MPLDKREIKCRETRQEETKLQSFVDMIIYVKKPKIPLGNFLELIRIWQSYWIQLLICKVNCLFSRQSQAVRVYDT